MYDYLEQVQSAVRRLNYRVSRLVKELGSRSPIVENIIAKIDLMFDGNTRFKDGTIQVVKPKDIFLDPKKSKALQEMDKSVPTWGDLRRQYEEKFKEAKEKDVFGGADMDLKTFIHVSESLPDALATMYTLLPEQNAQASLSIMQRGGRKKTYEELSQVITNIQKSEARARLLASERVRYRGV